MERRSVWPAVVLLVMLVAIGGVGAGYWWSRADVPQGAGEPKSLPIDNSKLVMSLGFGQKPDGHVDVIKMNAQGFVLCVPVSTAAAAPAPKPVDTPEQQR